MSEYCVIGQLDERCSKCKTWHYNPGGPCCNAITNPSGCDGGLCLVVGETGYCNGTIPLDGHQINLYNSSGDSLGYAYTNCLGEAAFQLSECGTYIWEHGDGGCFLHVSGTVTYEISGQAPGTCQRRHPIYIVPQSGFCDTSPLVVLSASFADASYTLSDTSLDATIYTSGALSCGGAAGSRSAYGGQIYHFFCTHSDECHYTVTVDGIETDLFFPQFTIDGNGCVPANGPPVGICGSNSVSTVCTGVLGPGFHALSFDYSKANELHYSPPGYGHFLFELNNCLSVPCDTCRCERLDRTNLPFEYYDTCFGLDWNKSGSLTYHSDNGTCYWEYPCITGESRIQKFVLVCRDTCCDPISTGFPFKPKDFSDNKNIYLYEFYKKNYKASDVILCDQTCGYCDWDYYIWTPDNDCIPLNFRRDWEKCKGAVDPSCNYYFKLYPTTGCATECNGCTFCMTFHGVENHLPVKNAEIEIWDSPDLNYIKGAGYTDSNGQFCTSLSTGDDPWFYILHETCYAGMSGSVDCNGLDTYVDTSSSCVVHSGACTLCEGLPIRRTLSYSDSFTEGQLTYGSSWYNNKCIQIASACFKDSNGDCQCVAPGYSLSAIKVECENDDWKLTLTLPYKSCDCVSCADNGACTSGSCLGSLGAAFSDDACITGLDTACAVTKEYIYYNSSGDFSVTCDPFMIEFSQNYYNEAPCLSLLYAYDLLITE